MCLLLGLLAVPKPISLAEEFEGALSRANTRKAVDLFIGQFKAKDEDHKLFAENKDRMIWLRRNEIAGNFKQLIQDGQDARIENVFLHESGNQICNNF